jgi:hypothetical protein
MEGKKKRRKKEYFFKFIFLTQEKWLFSLQKMAKGRLKKSLKKSSTQAYFFVTRVSFSWGRLAQLVEQLTLNQRVTGSSPVAPTTFSLRIFLTRRRFFSDRRIFFRTLI